MAKIIIQENDGAVLDVLTLALEMEGHLPIPMLVDCPIVLSEKIRQHEPDLVLMEYRPNLKAADLLLDAVRKVSDCLPVIALSGDLNIDKLASRIGFDGYVCKPFDLEELYGRVRYFIAPRSSAKTRLTS